MLKIIALVGFLAVSLAHADPTVIEDPAHLLDQADRFVAAGAAPAFQSAYKLGDSVTYDGWVNRCAASCGADGCGYYCEKLHEPVPITRSVGECAADKVTIYSDDGRNQEITAPDFEARHGDIGRVFLEQLNDFTGIQAGLRLTGATQAEFKVDPSNASEKALDALNITGELVLPGQGNHPGVSVMLTLVRGVPGVAQVARFRFGDTTWFRLKNWSRK